MFYHCNDYLIPVLVGDARLQNRHAAIILKNKRARPHIFGDNFSFVQQLRYNCHRVAPHGEHWLFRALLDFADQIDEYYTPAIIVCGDADREFVLKFKDDIEKRFIVIDFEKYMSKGENDE